MEKVLVTGVAGFIGSYIANRLLDNNYQVIGIDNMNTYYDESLKQDRLNIIKDKDNFTFIKEDINNKDEIKDIFNKYKPDIVLHLAAYAGVRYSTIDPDLYINNNILGFYNILSISKEYNVKHFIFSSSSSIYGNNPHVPYKEEDVNINQESIYASTKMCDEVISYSFSKLYDIPITSLRFFTVYGPFGRPDMAYFKFTKKLLNKKEITLYNKGELKRDFTYITDIVDGIYSVISNKPKELYNVYNIGASKQYTVNELVTIIKKELIHEKLVPSDYGFDSLIKYGDIEKGDVYETFSDISKIKENFNYNPKVSLEEGIREFIKWYNDYYKK